ncbi:hypothetical protein [Rhodobium gokarnense]|uniref:Uncharacterized protein n=1 Tax=Rhodobium gokarnense TaxID=364296 RepID=A0ABT3H600_9HYPH|nr:hypothetical protein [Rhodobium gokarnense]MCW2305818.1 hypothetical protein [Rhodobium gokarnense]
MKPIVITGDSHIGVLKRGYDRSPLAQGYDILFEPIGSGAVAKEDFFNVNEEKKFVRVRELKKPDGTRLNKGRIFPIQSLRKQKKAAHYFVSLPLNTSRILREYNWRTYVPWNLRQADWEIPLSEAAVAALIQQDAQYACGFVEALVDVGLQVAVVEAPRFFSDSPYLEKHRLEVCSHISERYRSYVKDRLRARDIDIVEQPEETIAADGTTRMEYDHEGPKDVHHANVAFGRLMVERIVAMARAREPKSLFGSWKTPGRAATSR